MKGGDKREVDSRPGRRGLRLTMPSESGVSKKTAVSDRKLISSRKGGLSELPMLDS